MSNKQYKYMKYHIKSMKILPVIMFILSWISLILIYIGYNPILLIISAGMSIIPIVLLYIASYALNFCNIQRMYLHYVVICNIFYWSGYVFSFVLLSIKIFNLVLIITGVFLLLILIKWIINK